MEGGDAGTERQLFRSLTPGAEGGVPSPFQDVPHQTREKKPRASSAVDSVKVMLKTNKLESIIFSVVYNSLIARF